jgi:predicted DNA-binding protein
VNAGIHTGIANLPFWYYHTAMTTISLKLPDTLESRLTVEAKRRRTSKSAIIREAVEQALAQQKRFVSCADLAGDLIGSQPGPRDASTNQEYLRDLGRERRHRTH